MAAKARSRKKLAVLAVATIALGALAGIIWSHNLLLKQSRLLNAIKSDDPVELKSVLIANPSLLDASFRPPQHLGEQTWNIQLASAHYCAANCIQVLSEMGVSFNVSTPKYGIPAIMVAARSSDDPASEYRIVNSIHAMLRAGADVDAVWENACLTTHTAELLRASPRWSIVDILIQNNSNVDFKPCGDSMCARTIISELRPTEVPKHLYDVYFEID